MQSYLVKLDFYVAFGLCDPTEGQTPPGTPEEIADLNPELLLERVREGQAPERIRFYHSEMRIDGETERDAVKPLRNLFDHLPGFDVSALTTELATEPTATAATKEYVVICHFRSVEAFFRLNNAFHAQVAEGLFFPAPEKPGQFVAYVVMHAPSSDGLEKAVEGLLRTAFDAHSPETADRFTEVTTNLL